MVEIEVDGLTAQIKDGVWSSSDEFLLMHCELLTIDHPWSPEPSNPDPDYGVAEHVAKKLHGTITHHDEIEYLDFVDY